MHRAMSAGAIAGFRSRARRIAGREPTSRSERSTTTLARSPPAAPSRAAIGNKIAIDMINEKGGVEGHKIIVDRGRRAVQDRRRHQRGRAACSTTSRSTC